MSRAPIWPKIPHVAVSHMGNLARAQIHVTVYLMHVTHCVTWEKTCGYYATCHLATSLNNSLIKIKVLYVYIYTLYVLYL
jgi:hypothetical protein